MRRLSRIFLTIIPFAAALGSAFAVAGLSALLAWRSPPPPPFTYITPPRALGATALCPGDWLVYQTVVSTEGSPAAPGVVERRRTLWDADQGYTVREVTQDVDNPATSIWFETRLVTNTIRYRIPAGLAPGPYQLRTVAYGPETTPRGGPVPFTVRADCPAGGD